MNTNFFDLAPGFISGTKVLHNDLIGVCFVLALTGLLIHTIHAMIRRDLAGMFPTLVRLAVVAILVGTLGSWGDLLVSSVSGLISDLGAGALPSTVFDDYQAAIARKLGTAAAAANINQTNAIAPSDNGDNGAANAGQSASGNALSGVTLTHYAYPGDSTPDSKSAQGIGAFPFSSAPGSLIPMYSAALTASAAQAYNVSPGQSFTVTTSAGQTYNLLYADVAPESDQRVDIYDPNNALGGGNNFSQGITSINGGPVVAGQTGFASMLPNPGGSIGDQVLWAITLGLSWIALGLQWLMQILQAMLYLIEIAISPIFIGFLMIPALTHLARRFFLTLAAVCLWPLGWTVANLVTLVMINLMVNPTNNAGLGALNTAAVVTGPLAGIAMLLALSVWVIGSTLGAPLFIGFLLSVGGGTATSMLFGATLGAAASTAARMGSSVIGGPAGAAALIGSIGGNGSNGGPVSIQSASRMNGATPSFAKRPMTEQGA